MTRNHESLADLLAQKPRKTKSGKHDGEPTAPPPAPCDYPDPLIPGSSACARYQYCKATGATCVAFDGHYLKGAPVTQDVLDLRGEGLRMPLP